MNDLAFTIFAGISLLLVLLPLSLHWRVGNVGTVFLLLWCFVTCFVHFMNSILWWGSSDKIAKVWCDISVKILSSFAVGLTASGLCINRRLAGITSARSVDIRGRRRAPIVVDLVLCVGLPVITMVLSYVFQPHRFDIMEGIGPVPTVWKCLQAILTIYLLPVLLSIVSACYGRKCRWMAQLTSVYAAYFFVVRRSQIKELLKSGQSGLELAHCVRLILLSTIDIILCLPMGLYGLVDGLQNRVVWDSWANVHAQWSRIVVFTDNQVLPSNHRTMELFLPRWGLCMLSLCAFLLIGTGHDAIRQYRSWLQLIPRPPSVHGSQMLCETAPPPARVELGSTVLHATELTKLKVGDIGGQAFIQTLKSSSSCDDGVAVGIQVRKEVA